MVRITVSRRINAPIGTVFHAISDIETFSKAVPDIVRVDFLTEAQSGVGTRFRETRIMRGKEASTDLEVTEYVENDRVRLVSDSHGTVWDSVFTVREADGATELTMVMEATAKSIAARIVNKVVKGMITKAVSHDVDRVKEYCEP